MPGMPTGGRPPSRVPAISPNPRLRGARGLVRRAPGRVHVAAAVALFPSSLSQGLGVDAGGLTRGALAALLLFAAAIAALAASSLRRAGSGAAVPDASDPPPTGEAGTATPVAGTGVAPAPILALAKTASPTSYAYAGQVITYRYTLTNVGNVTLDGPFVVTDDRLGTLQCGAVLTLAVAASSPAWVEITLVRRALSSSRRSTLPHELTMRNFCSLHFFRKSRA